MANRFNVRIWCLVATSKSDIVLMFVSDVTLTSHSGVYLTSIYLIADLVTNKSNVHTANIQRLYNQNSTSTQPKFNVQTSRIECPFNQYAMSIQPKSNIRPTKINVHTTRTPRPHNPNSMSKQPESNVHTTNILCPPNQNPTYTQAYPGSQAMLKQL